MKPFSKLTPLGAMLTLFAMVALLTGCPDSTRPSPITPKIPQPTTPKVPQPKAQVGHSPGSDSSASSTGPATQALR